MCVSPNFSSYVVNLLLIVLFFIGNDANAYKGSHAYNHNKSFNAQVNTATGTFYFSYPLIKAPGLRIPLELNLTYSFNTKGMFGLPAGWTLDLDYINEKTAQLGGKQWLIDPLWHDETGFASGLKYYNQHGSALKDELISIPVPHNPEFKYRYQSLHKDGSRQYFSHQGLLILQVDRFGNQVQYDYEKPVEQLATARLATIRDNYGNEYRFNYAPDEIIIDYPDGREQHIYYNSEGVVEIINPLKQSYAITYRNAAGRKLLHTMKSPEGLQTELAYDSIPYISHYGARQMPVVKLFKQFDLADDKIHHEAHYKYGLSSNYTGYPTYRLSSNSDSLIDSNDEDYKYTVEVTLVNGEQSHHQAYQYNYLHLPVEVRTTRQDTPIFKTTYAYVISPFKYSRSTNYDKPATVTNHVWDKHHSAYLPSDETSYTYDRFGNKLSQTYAAYDQQLQQWVTLNQTTNSYFYSNYSLLAERNQTDLLSGKAIRTRYKLAASGKTHGAELVSWKPSKAIKDWQLWQYKGFTFDNKGRKSSSTLKWLADHKAGIQSVKHSTEYHFNATSRVLKKTEISDSGRKHVQFIDTRNARKLKTLTPKGEQTTYTYDALNRPLTHTAPGGYTSYISYEDFASDGHNAITHQNPTGYKKRSLHDASGRPIALQDQHQGRWRTLSSQSFDSFAKIERKSDIQGLITTFAHDEQGRKTQTKDPWGNVHRIEYNDVDRITTTWINERKHQVIKKVPWQRKRITQIYPVTDNPHSKPAHFLEKAVVHDAFDKVINASSALIGLHTQTLSQPINHTYQYDASQNRTEVSTTTWDGLHTTKTYQYDLLNHLYTWHKRMSAPKSGSSHEGYRYLYDGDGLLKQVESPKNKDGERFHLQYRYDKNGNQTELILPDGHRITYAYNERGLRTHLRWQRDNSDYEVKQQYDAAGKLILISNNKGQKMRYRYSPEGFLLDLCYPDNLSLSYTLDDYNHVTVQKDVNQQERKFAYLPQDKGRLSSVQIGDSRVDFHYGKDDNGQLGQLIKQTINDAKTGQTKTHFYYGASGHEVKSTSTNDRVNYDVNYQYSPRGELSTQSWQLHEQGKVPQTQTTEYEYDGMQRLTDERQIIKKGKEAHHKHTHYRYDGNNNLIEERTRTPCGKQILYSYNRLDQLESVNINGTCHRVLHDASGRLRQDHLGTQYEYDDAAYLLSVTPKNQQPTHYQYLPNGLLWCNSALHCHNISYYPDINKNIQAIKNDRQWHLPVRYGKNMVAIKTADGMDQLFKLNQSTGGVLHQNANAKTHFKVKNFDAYGQPSEQVESTQSEASNMFLWNQELTDPKTSLTYLRNRFYYPALRRFITKDSLAVDNRYAYAHASPVNYIDPTGQSPVLSYVSGGISTALGILGIFLSIPTGGASLTMSAAAGISAGVGSAISGVSVIGAQAALSSGNAVASGALTITGFILDAIATIELVAAVAPEIASLISDSAQFPRTEIFSTVREIKNPRKLINNDVEKLSGEKSVLDSKPDFNTVLKDLPRVKEYTVDGVDMRQLLLQEPAFNPAKAGVSNAFFESGHVHQGISADLLETFMKFHPGELLNQATSSATRTIPASYEVTGNVARLNTMWSVLKVSEDEEYETGPEFMSTLTMVYDRVKQSYSWYFEYPLGTTN